MFIERKINKDTGTIELWGCEWENRSGTKPRKVYIKKLCDEQPSRDEKRNRMTEAPAICWSYGRTLGNIAVFSQSVLGSFSGKEGDDAVLPCDFVNAGKFRHGPDRWWCRTHQNYWGTKADIEAFELSGEMTCSNHDQRMHYVVSPYTVNLNDYAEVGIWCSMPAAISTVPIEKRPPKIHVHIRPEVDGKKVIDRDFKAISVLYNTDAGLFGSNEITRVNITPPAAFEFVCNLEMRRAMDCVNCSRCGFPHLDLGDFAKTAHKKHFCANCGFDSTWSKGPIVSTPLKPLHDQYLKSLKYEAPNRSLNLDEFKGCNYTVWASTPAVLWTAKRPQELGIHVHVHRGAERIIDDTFDKVIQNGEELNRAKLVNFMMERTVI